MINRQSFYDKIRPLFGQRVLPKQFAGMEVILNEWDQSGLSDPRWLAYMLATTFHETAYTMQPVKEYGGNQYFIKRYYENEKIRKALGNTSAQDAVDYCGKGYVQITGRRNYKRMGDIIDIDLIGSPDLAMKPEIAVKIMFEGMVKGHFTGKKLADYFNTVNDWCNARRIINGIDKAEIIKGYGLRFFDSLN